MRGSMRAFALLIGASLVACGGGGGGSGSGGSSVVTAPVAPAQHVNASATFVLTIARATSSTTRKPAFLDAATQSLEIALTQVDGTPPATTVQTIADIGPTAAGCTATASTIACTIGIGAIVGADTYTVTAFDKPAGAGNVLSQGSTNLTITQNGPNTGPIVLSGVVSSLGVALTNPFLPTAASGTTPVTVTAKDASGATIVGSYSGTVTLTSSDPSVTIAPASVTSSATAITASFTGAARNAVTITAALSGANAANALLTPTTNILNYPIPTAKSNSFQIVQGPDGAIYFAELGPVGLIDPVANFYGALNTGVIGRLDPSSGTITEVPLGTGLYDPIGLVFTSDGALWTALLESHAVARIAPFAATGVAAFPIPLMTPTALPTPPTFTVRPRSLVATVGKVFATVLSNSTIVAYDQTSPYASGTPIPLPSSTGVSHRARPQGITVGSDGNLWVADNQSSRVLRVDPISGAVSAFATTVANSAPRFIASGSDGNLYMGGGNFDSFYGGGFLNSFTTAGAATNLPLPSAYSYPDTIVPGPPGTLYFADLGYGIAGIGSVTTAGAVQSWPIATVPTQPTDGAEAVAYATDGSIYFTTAGSGGEILPGAPLVQGYAQGEIRRLILAQGWTMYPPSPIVVPGTGAQNAQLIGFAETGDSSPFTATTSNPGVATVATLSGFSHNLSIVGVGPGSCTITVTDRSGRSVTAQVTVSQTTGSIQSLRRRQGAPSP